MIKSMSMSMRLLLGLLMRLILLLVLIMLHLWVGIGAWASEVRGGGGRHWRVVVASPPSSHSSRVAMTMRRPRGGSVRVVLRVGRLHPLVWVVGVMAVMRWMVEVGFVVIPQRPTPLKLGQMRGLSHSRLSLLMIVMGWMLLLLPVTCRRWHAGARGVAHWIIRVGVGLWGVGGQGCVVPRGGERLSFVRCHVPISLRPGNMSMVVVVLGGGRAIDSRVGRRRVPNCVETSFIPQGLPGCHWRGYSSSTMLLLCKHLKEVNVLRLQRCGRRLLPLEGWRRGGEELTVLMVAVGAAGNAVMVWIVVHDVVSERVGYRLAPWCMGGHDGGEGGGDVCEGKDAVGIVDHLPPPSCCPPLEKEREECIN